MPMCLSMYYTGLAKIGHSILAVWTEQYALIIFHVQQTHRSSCRLDLVAS